METLGDPKLSSKYRGNRKCTGNKDRDFYIKWGLLRDKFLRLRFFTEQLYVQFIFSITKILIKPE